VCALILGVFSLPADGARAVVRTRPVHPVHPVHRPAVRVAGVARRTTRRVIRRSTVYVATLPCSTIVMIDGVRLYHCGNTYYQAYNNQYVVVYLD
jgi:hypothetical protein